MQRERERGGSRGYSLDIRDHEGLLHKLTRRAHGGMLGAGLRVEYDDLYQEMCFAFVKASKHYDPSRGFTFSAYFGRACANRYKNLISRMMKEETLAKQVSFSDLSRDSTTGEKEENFVDNIAADHVDLGEKIDVMVNARKSIKLLSNDAKLAVREILSPNKGVLNAVKARQKRGMSAKFDVRFSDIATAYGFSKGRFYALEREVEQFAAPFEKTRRMSKQSDGGVATKRCKVYMEPGPVSISRGYKIKGSL